VTRDRFQADRDKRRAVLAAEAAGEVADSHAVRIAIVERMNRGEITLEQAQAELRAIKRGARRAGKVTRAQVWRRS
jgi:hypothetical protein